MRAAALLPCRILRRLDQRLGRRGSYLACAGSAWTMYGLGIIISPRPGTVRGMLLLRNIAPLEFWGAIWVVCGLTAIAFAFTRTGRDVYGFVAAVIPTLVWCVAYGAAMIAGDFPYAWVSAATWGFAALRLIVVSGWPEPAGAQQKREAAHG
ncbi:hypothetical protein [Streptomyces sp. NPDC101249]|uniref:hypothetical protein n=1 Tax=Streptomyces sp. NPDC101249 TaxID=3366140 RepID=UPI00380EA345